MSQEPTHATNARATPAHTKPRPSFTRRKLHPVQYKLHLRAWRPHGDRPSSAPHPEARSKEQSPSVYITRISCQMPLQNVRFRLQPLVAISADWPQCVVCEDCLRTFAR